MYRSHLLLSCVLLLAACGGGGGGGRGGLEQVPVVKIDSNVVAPISTTYRATFDCTARVRVSGQALPLTVNGTYVLAAETTPVTSPVNALSGVRIKNTVDFTVRTEPYHFELTEFVSNDLAGRWWSLGGEDASGTRSWWSGDPVVYGVPISESVTGRLLNLDSTLTVGQVLTIPATDALSDDLLDTLFTRSGTRTVNALEVVETAIGRFEAYKVTHVEVVDLNDGNGPISVTYTRWERPDMGLIQLQALDREVTDGTTTINLDELLCTLSSYTP